MDKDQDREPPQPLADDELDAIAGGKKATGFGKRSDVQDAHDKYASIPADY